MLNRFTKTDQALVFLSLIVSFSALIYFIYALNTIGIIVVLILTLIAFFLLLHSPFTKSLEAPIVKEKEVGKPLTRIDLLNLIAYFSFIIVVFIELLLARTGASLVSPFQVLGFNFFFAYTLASLLLFYILSTQAFSHKHNSYLIALHFFTSLSLTLIIYKIGYGYDPFIHQATIDLIIQKGLVLPKTPYYLGHYGLIVLLKKVFFMPFTFSYKVSTPLLASLILPTLGFRFLKKYTNTENKKTIALSVLLGLALTLNLFIVSTPQNLSYIFLALTIYSSLISLPWLFTFIFSLSTLAIHPLAGIPALIWSFWLLFKKHQARLKKKTAQAMSRLLMTASILLIPLALFLSSGAKLTNLKLSFTGLTQIRHLLFNFSYSGNHDWLLNITYMFNKFWPLLIIVIAIIGINLLTRKSRQAFKDQTWAGLIFISLGLVLAFILSSFISFSNIIAYEQNNFANRIIIILSFFLSPFILLGLYHILNQIFTYPKQIIRKIILTLFFFFFLLNFYLSYPRLDKYEHARGFSTSSEDIEVVKEIDQYSDGNYIVLANQQVSAAALKEFGFNNYYGNEVSPIYFYPIPTGGPLYQFYLDMVYQAPSRETMLLALELAEVNEGFFVVNKYWLESDKIIKRAKLSADDWFSLALDEVFVFYYKK